MSALGQKRTFRPLTAMFAIPPKADIRRCVRPMFASPLKADIWWRTTHARPWDSVMIAAIQRDRSDIDQAEPFH